MAKVRNRFVRVDIERKTQPVLLAATQMPLLITEGVDIPFTRIFSYEQAEELLEEASIESGGDTAEALGALKLMFDQKQIHNEIGFISVSETEGVTDLLDGDIGESYYITTTIQDMDVLKSLISKVSKMRNIFFPTVTSLEELDELRDYAKEIDAGDRTWVSVHETQMMGVAVVADISGHFFGHYWPKFKTLEGIEPVKFNYNEVTTIDKANGNTYSVESGRRVVTNSKLLSGEFLDIVQTEDRLHSKITDRIFTTLTKTKKIPYTQKGIDLIHAALIEVLREDSLEEVGVLALDENGNATYKTSAPLRSELDSAIVASRVLPNVKFIAIPTGAIGEVEIHGVLTFDMGGDL